MGLTVLGNRTGIPMKRIPGTHFFSIPATVGGNHDARLIFDTGVGPSIVTGNFAERVHCRPAGESFTGRRMSGQEVTMPLVSLESLAVGPVFRENAIVGSFDIFGEGTQMPEGFAGIEGFLSPAFFEGIPFTLELAKERILVESEQSLSLIRKTGKSVPLRIERDGPSVTMFIDLLLPDGEVAVVEVDTGSDILILNKRYMHRLGIEKSGSATTKIEGKDETGHSYVRYRAPVSGLVHLESHHDLFQAAPEVMFQEIIYDGLVGVDFLKRYAVTFNTAGSELIFNMPQRE